jgi:hypothetical protein
MRSPRKPSAAHPLALLAAALALGSAAACGTTGSGVVATADDPALGTTLQAVCIQTDATPAGASASLTGRAIVAPNGVCQNGLAGIGLVPTSAVGAAFTAWFNRDVRASEILMPYLYSCAAPSWQAVTWTNPQTGVAYTWTGGLGLAPSWANGSNASVTEQQAVSACLAARVNKYGVSVQVAIEGRTAAGGRIPIAPDELATYSVREGCFFGNLFNGDGVFVGLDHAAWSAATSSARACALAAQFNGSSAQCPPLFQVGACADVCRRDGSGTFYESCTWNGKTYTRPLATRLRPSDLYQCGDGVCQMTESCGTGTAAASCAADCGACP